MMERLFASTMPEDEPDLDDYEEEGDIMVVDGVPNVRTCVTPLKAGMKVQTQYGVSAEPFEEQKTGGQTR